RHRRHRHACRSDGGGVAAAGVVAWPRECAPARNHGSRRRTSRRCNERSTILRRTTMSTTRRDLLKLGGLAAAGLGAGALLPAAAQGSAGPGKAARPLRILILGGTGFTGPHQVRHALARGHSVTLFNRGK